MNLILDTNVFISGIFWSGPPYQILKAWQKHRINLAVSKEILDEYDRVANTLSKQYPTIDLSSFIELLTIHARLYTPAILNE